MYMYIQYIESLLLITNPIAIYKTLFKVLQVSWYKIQQKVHKYVKLKFKVVFLMLVINYKLVEA